MLDQVDYECKENPCCKDDGWIMVYEHIKTGETILESEYMRRIRESTDDNSFKVRFWREMARECPCQEKIRKKEKMDRLLTDSNLSPRFKKRTFETMEWLDPEKFPESALGLPDLRKDINKLMIYQQKAYKMVKSYVLNFDDHAGRGEGFGLLGDYGTAKTHLLAAKTNYLLDHGVQSVYVNTADILGEIRKCFQPEEDGKTARQVNPSEILDLLKTCDDLSLDDIGKEKLTDWVRETFYIIINYRYEYEKPTSFTTNCTVEELQSHLGPATYRRLMEPAAGRLREIKGPSFERIRRLMIV